MAKLCAGIADDKKAVNVVVLKMTNIVGFTDYFVIANGTNPRQVGAIAEAIREALYARKLKCLGMEGLQDGRWALLDFGDVVVHVFDEATRAFYNLEHLWAEAPRVRWKTASRKTSGQEGKKS